MAKAAAGGVPKIDFNQRQKLVDRALGGLAPHEQDIKIREAFGGDKPDTVLIFDNKMEGLAVTQLMLEDMKIANAAGKQKAVAQRDDGRWEVLISDAQMRMMQSFVETKDRAHAAAAGAGQPAKNTCTIVGAKDPVPSVTFTFADPAELEAFTKSFPKRVSNYEINGNSLIIKQSKEPNSINVDVSELGSIRMGFDGLKSDKNIIREQLQKLLPGTHSEFDSLYFSQGVKSDVSYKLTSEAETEAFKRKLAFARLQNIERYENNIQDSRKSIYTDDKLHPDFINARQQELQEYKSSILQSAQNLDPAQKKAIQEYMENGAIPWRRDPAAFFDEKGLKIDDSFIQDLEIFREEYRAIGYLKEAAAKINESKAKIAEMNSMLDADGDRAKYAPAYAAMKNSENNKQQANYSMVKCDNKIRALQAFLDIRNNSKTPEMQAYVQKDDQKAAIDLMLAQNKHSDNTEFQGYVQALFDQKPGRLSEKLKYAYEKMEQDLRQLEVSKAALLDLDQRLAAEINELKFGVKNAADPALHDRFVEVTESANILAAPEAVTPQRAHAAAAGAGMPTPPAQPQSPQIPAAAAAVASPAAFAAPDDPLQKPSYKIIIDDATMAKAAEYKENISKGSITPGTLLGNKLQGKDLAAMDIEEFLEILVSTKQPCLFAESHPINVWNDHEQSLLANIHPMINVAAYNDGLWANPNNHETPIPTKLIFTSSALLRNNSADLKALTNADGSLNAEAYKKEMRARLLPGFRAANDSASPGKKAHIRVPGMGCGQFAGNHKGKLEPLLRDVMQDILATEDLPNIGKVEFDAYQYQWNPEKWVGSSLKNSQDPDVAADEIKGVKFVTKSSNGKEGPLAKPDEGMELVAFVAADFASWPGNDMFVDSRSTDEGVKGFSTNAAQAITGIEGRYDEKRFKPLQGNSWFDAANQPTVDKEAGQRFNSHKNQWEPTANLPPNPNPIKLKVQGNIIAVKAHNEQGQAHEQKAFQPAQPLAAAAAGAPFSPPPSGPSNVTVTFASDIYTNKFGMGPINNRLELNFGNNEQAAQAFFNRFDKALKGRHLQSPFTLERQGQNHVVRIAESAGWGMPGVYTAKDGKLAVSFLSDDVAAEFKDALNLNGRAKTGNEAGSGSFYFNNLIAQKAEFNGKSSERTSLQAQFNPAQGQGRAAFVPPAQPQVQEAPGGPVHPAPPPPPPPPPPPIAPPPPRLPENHHAKLTEKLFEILEFPPANITPVALVASVKQLLDNGANVNARNSQGKTPFHVLAENPGLFIPDPQNPMQFVGQHIVGEMHKKNPGMDARDSKGKTPLHDAVLQDNQYMAHFLMDINAKFATIPDNDGNTPLHNAVQTRNGEMIGLLLNNPARAAALNILNKDGKTPLDIINETMQAKGIKAAAQTTNQNILDKLKMHNAKTGDQIRAEEMMGKVLGDKAKYTTEFRPAMMNNGRQWVPDPVKKDIALVFNNLEDAQKANLALNADPYKIGGKGHGGMKAISREGDKYVIKLSEDNVKAISAGLSPGSPNPNKAFADRLVEGMMAAHAAGAPKAQVPHKSQEQRDKGLGG